MYCPSGTPNCFLRYEIPPNIISLWSKEFPKTNYLNFFCWSKELPKTNYLNFYIAGITLFCLHFLKNIFGWYRMLGWQCYSLGLKRCFPSIFLLMLLLMGNLLFFLIVIPLYTMYLFLWLVLGY